MKSFGKHIIILSLVLSVLISSTGFSQYRYFCRMLDQVETSLKEPKPCCQKNDCCHISVDFKKQDLLDHLKFQHFEFQVLLFSEKLPTFNFSNPINFPLTEKSILSFSDTSPPLSGRQICILKRSFLI